MTSAREEILSRLNRSRPPTSESPVEMTPPPRPEDPLGMLQDRVQEAGGVFQTATRLDWPNQVTWPVPLGEIDHLYSSDPALQNRGVAESAATPHALDALEVCVLRCEFAVVENAAIWHIPATPRERAAALLATHLVLVVGARELVPTLHEAYDRIELATQPFGWFLCGPSKTADIEQSLVLGAHGPCSMSLILIHD